MRSFYYCYCYYYYYFINLLVINWDSPNASSFTGVRHRFFIYSHTSTQLTQQIFPLMVAILHCVAGGSSSAQCTIVSALLCNVLRSRGIIAVILKPGHADVLSECLWTGVDKADNLRNEFIQVSLHS